jgi:hypothetical protein
MPWLPGIATSRPYTSSRVKLALELARLVDPAVGELERGQAHTRSGAAGISRHMPPLCSEVGHRSIGHTGQAQSDDIDSQSLFPTLPIHGSVNQTPCYSVTCFGTRSLAQRFKVNESMHRSGRVIARFLALALDRHAIGLACGTRRQGCATADRHRSCRTYGTAGRRHTMPRRGHRRGGPGYISL